MSGVIEVLKPAARATPALTEQARLVLLDSRTLLVPGWDAGAVPLRSGGCAWVSGYCFAGDEPQLGRELAEAVSAALAAPDMGAALTALNGSFCAVLVSAAHDRVDVVTDRFGTRAPYYALEGDRLLVGEDFWALCNALGAPRLSVDAAVELLTFDYVMGEHTLVEQIRDVPGGTPWRRLTLRLALRPNSNRNSMQYRSQSTLLYLTPIIFVKYSLLPRNSQAWQPFPQVGLTQMPARCLNEDRAAG